MGTLKAAANIAASRGHSRDQAVHAEVGAHTAEGSCLLQLLEAPMQRIHQLLQNRASLLACTCMAISAEAILSQNLWVEAMQKILHLHAHVRF